MAHVKGEPNKGATGKLNFYRTLLSYLIMKNGGRIEIDRADWERLPKSVRMKMEDEGNRLVIYLFVDEHHVAN